MTLVVQKELLDAFETLSDEEIVEMVRDGNLLAEEHLINKYRNFVRAKARSYFLIGADREDIIQEGMIGLFKAIRDFRCDKLSSFRAFAELCVTRQIITAIKTTIQGGSSLVRASSKMSSTSTYSRGAAQATTP